jgi:hypothetical protein
MILSVALVASGMGLMRVTSPAGKHPLPAQIPRVDKPASSVKQTPFHLQLSAPARLVEIDTGHLFSPLVDASMISGTLDLDQDNPRVSLMIRWKNPAVSGEHRFAKLTLESPGEKTLTHVFDSDGDIDDILELPLPASQ